MSGGDSCPDCKQVMVLLATTNEWKWHCEKCDERFNDDGERHSEDWKPEVME